MHYQIESAILSILSALFIQVLCDCSVASQPTIVATLRFDWVTVLLSCLPVHTGYLSRMQLFTHEWTAKIVHCA